MHGAEQHGAKIADHFPYTGQACTAAAKRLLPNLRQIRLQCHRISGAFLLKGQGQLRGFFSKSNEFPLSGAAKGTASGKEINPF